jgi:hypothetical protein
MIKLAPWKRAFAFLFAFATPAAMYIVFDGFNEFLEFIPFMYLFFAAVATAILFVLAAYGEDVIL